MAQFGAVIQTAQVTTGNFRTTMDKYDTTKPNNAAQNPLGCAYIDNAVSASNPNGAPTKYRYVRYNSTANAAVQATPAGVWWTDATMTVVTSTKSEAWGGSTGGQNFCAGLLMLNSTDVSTLTAAILNGNYVWIAVAGYVKSVASAAAAAGDQLYLSQGDWTTTGGFSKVAVGGATVGRIFGIAVGASASDVFVTCESI